MECGNFDGVRSIQTTYDRRLDAESDSDGQLLEKMVSGRYLGEIVRLAMLDLASTGRGFGDWLDGSSVFNTPYAFTTEHMSDIAFDGTEDLTGTAMLLRSLGVSASALDDRRRLREISAAVAHRSARLVASAIAATSHLHRSQPRKRPHSSRRRQRDTRLSRIPGRSPAWPPRHSRPPRRPHLPHLPARRLRAGRGGRGRGRGRGGPGLRFSGQYLKLSSMAIASWP